MSRQKCVIPVLAILSLFVFFVSNLQATWMIDTIHNATYFKLENKHSIALDSMGAPHIVYGGDHLYHAYYTGGAWQEERIDSSLGVGINASIVIDASDKIHIFYENYVSSATGSARNKYATNASGSWVIQSIEVLPVETDDSYIDDLLMAVDRTGKIHMVYAHSVWNTDHWDETIVYLTNASGEWISQVAADFVGENPAAWPQIYDFAMADDGSVHILCKMWPLLKYVTNASGSWMKEEITGVWNGTRDAAICTDNAGQVHVAYGGPYSGIGNDSMLKYAFRAADGWHTDTAPIDPVNIADSIGSISMAVDGSNIVHVSYADLSTNSIKYAKGISDSWQVEPLASIDDLGTYDSVSLTVNDAGTAHIAFWDNGSSAVKYAGKVTGSWAIQTIKSGSLDLRDLSLGLDSSQALHLGYRDWITKQVWYASGKYQSWSRQTLSASSYGIPKLGLTPDDSIHILSKNTDAEKMACFSKTGDAWTETLLDLEMADFFHVDPSGKMHVGYRMTTGNYPNTIQHIMYATADGPHVPWQIGEVKRIDPVPDAYSYLRLYSMAVDQAGKAHMIYTTDDRLMSYTTNASESWQDQTVVQIAGPGDNRCLDSQIAIDSSGTAHVVYIDLENENYYPTRMMYINNRSGSSWGNLETITLKPQGLNYILNIEFDSQDFLHISYLEIGKGLMHAVGTQGAWTVEVVDATPPISNHDMKIDGADNVHIAYREYGGRDIKYATNSVNDEWGPDGLNPTYDGNNDGTPDSDQGNVVSFNSHDNGAYFTLAAPGGTTIQNLQAVDNPSPINTPQGIDFPFGFVQFLITDLAEPGVAVTLHLYLPEGASPSTYWQYGATPDNSDPHWYEFLFDGTTGAEFNHNEIILHFVDGQRGDHDLAANGSIVDPGGPGFGASAIIGDLNGDNCVDRTDYSIIIGEIRSPAPHDPLYDLNQDGIVNISDARYLVTQFTNPRGTACEGAGQ